MTAFRLGDTAAALETRIRANRLMDLSATCPWADEIVFPAYDGLSILNVTHAAAGLLGVTLPGSAPLRDEVWGDREVSDNNLDVFIRLLRGKVDAEGEAPLIHTERGVGYRLRSPEC